MPLRLPTPRQEEPYRRFMIRCQEDENMEDTYDDDDVRIRRECQLIWDNKEANMEQTESKEEANNGRYLVKGSAEIKDLDTTKREVAVYLSKFNNIDSDNDMIVKGAFKQSLKQHGPNSATNRRIQFLRHHDWTKQIGVFNRLEEDENGLFAVGRLGTSTLGEDAWKDYQEGIIREHSIGYQLIPSKVKWVKDGTMEKGGYNMIQELKLFEGSAVTFGSNEMTNVVEIVKGQNKINLIDEIEEELFVILKSLSTGQGSDERLYGLEMRAKYLSSRLVTLAKLEPLIKSTQTDIKSVNAEVEFDWSRVINGLNV
jgi:HK97 family phage prohead protease